jgi:hypothetical protein
MTLQLIHTLGDRVVARYGAQPLFEYVYRPTTPALESPKPYLHPMHTLGGNCVTGFRPHDHTWHHGLAMTSAHLSLGDAEGPAENFWGGATYVRDQGYVQLDNNGRIEHVGWDGMDCDGARATLREHLRWVAHDGVAWLDERREIGIGEVNTAESFWRLDYASTLVNVARQPLFFGSPTTAGREMAGYGGLFWRGPRSFLGGRILAAGGLEGPDVMGQPAAWLSFTGAHDGSGDRSTLVFVDQPGNPRYPNKWFARNDPYSGASFAFAFDEEYVLAPGASLAVQYRLLIADGAWSREQIDSHMR